MEEKCLCQPTEILIFPCSGGSNVGQIANQAGVRLTQNGLGRFFCLAGVGGHVSGMIESTKAGKIIVAIDGCPVACAKKTLEHTGFNIDEYIEITSMGIEKNHDLTPRTSDVEKVSQYLSTQISKRRGLLWGKQMIVKPVSLKLNSEEILRLVKIFLDEDKEDAFSFLKEVLKPRVDQATREQWEVIPFKLRVSWKKNLFLKNEVIRC